MFRVSPPSSFWGGERRVSGPHHRRRARVCRADSREINKPDRSYVGDHPPRSRLLFSGERGGFKDGVGGLCRVKAAHPGGRGERGRVSERLSAPPWRQQHAGRAGAVGGSKRVEFTALALRTKLALRFSKHKRRVRHYAHDEYGKLG